MKLRLSAKGVRWPWPPLFAGLVCSGVGFGLGGMAWQDDIDALQHLQDEVPALQSRLAASPVSVSPNERVATSAQPRAALFRPDARQAAVFWPVLQQGLQGQGLQLQSMKPGPLESAAGWPTQTVVLDVQGRWDDWRAFEQQLDRHAPWWTVMRWQVTPLAAGANGRSDAGQVRMQWHFQWGWQPASAAASPAPAAPVFGPDVSDGPAAPAADMAVSLFAEPGVEPTLPAAAQTAQTAGPAERWPVQALRLQGVWQQGGVWHAVLGRGLDQVAVAPGQAVGREAYRVLRVSADEVVLQPPHSGQAPLRLGWSGGGR